jgi:sugar O-acyltransferase (sialic acid O-acetyltransferase NeuD family)
MTSRLAIIGASDLGKLIAYHAQSNGRFAIAGFFDDFLEAGTNVHGHKVIGALKDIELCYRQNKFTHLMMGIGYKHMQARKTIFDTYKSAIPFANVLHSSAYIDPSVKLGEGIFILPGVVIDMGVVLGDNILLNTATTIAHDSTIGSHCFLSPRVAVAGKVSIGECCVIGINSTVIDNIRICNQVRTGGGAVVTKTIEAPGLYVGAPARFIR